MILFLKNIIFNVINLCKITRFAFLKTQLFDTVIMRCILERVIDL